MADPSAFLVSFATHMEQAEGEDLVERIVDRTYAEVPAYAGVPRDDLLGASRQTKDVGAAAFRESRMATPADLAFDAEVVRRRIRQGVTPAGWIAHGRVFMEELCAEAERFGRANGYPEAETMAAIVMMWADSQELTAFSQQQFEEAANEILEHEQAEREEYVQTLLRGGLTPARARSGAVALGLDPDALYRVVRVRPGSLDMVRRLSRAMPTVGARGLWVCVGEEVLGISPGGPPVDIAPATAGVGPPATLEGLPGSYALATTALETAVRFSLSGAHRIEDLGVLSLVIADGRVADALLERYVAQVERSGSSGPALVETMREFLARGLQPGETAKALHLHPNSLRKRMARYEELTGADLGSMDDLVAVWWALRRRDLRDG